MAAAIPIAAQFLQRQCLHLEHTLILPVSKALAAVALLAGAWVGPAAAAPLACQGPAHIRTGDTTAIASHVKATGKNVLSFVGYSGAGYQDPDVLDTWFSSWLWPMEVFGWNQQKENNAELD